MDERFWSRSVRRRHRRRLNRGLAGACFLLPEGPLRRAKSFDPIYVKQEGVLLLEISCAVLLLLLLLVPVVLLLLLRHLARITISRESRW